MKTIWYKGLDADQKKDLRADFISAQVLRKRLTALLQEKIEIKRATMRNDELYEKGSWGNLMADSLGYERALNEIISLIENEEN